MSGSNHHFTQAVDCKQCISADFEYAITVGNQFDLSFFDITAVHMNISGYTVENFCRFIFVKNTLLFFPNIKMFFSDGKKCRNIFFANDVTFLKRTPFFSSFIICVISWQSTCPTASSVRISFIASISCSCEILSKSLWNCRLFRLQQPFGFYYTSNRRKLSK